MKFFRIITLLFIANVSGLSISVTYGATLNLSDAPLFLREATPPLTMLVLGRDHKLFYEAYDDISDLNNDGLIDRVYNPLIDYAGYFNSHTCYSYSGGVFYPAQSTADKKCAAAWSGDFLNYLTMSRMDVLRKVLYGGKRSTDSTTETILERAYIPQDAHSWGKEYTSVAVDGYSISDYTPFALPEAGKHHLFANTTLLYGTGEPLLRIAINQPYRIWDWLSIERPVAGDRVQNGSSGPDISGSIIDHVVRVAVCRASLLEDNCQSYPGGAHKPIGLLQEFGENKSIKFGLLSGSYGRNLSGGMLRKNVGFIADEIDQQTGQLTAVVGIIKTIDRLRITGFSENYTYNCGFIFGRDMQEGECTAWGNPIAEMMYETLRYFAGKNQPSSNFVSTGGDDATLGLPAPSWKNPYANDENPWCAKPNMIVISDPYPTYDTDNVPGSFFNAVSDDLPVSLNASALAQTIWDTEQGGTSTHFVGESNAINDGAPTIKSVSSFGNIRGLIPADANKKGGYYSASAAYYGWLNDINTVKGDQKLESLILTMPSALPKFPITVGDHTITLMPFAKSVGGCGNISALEGNFQPTNTLIDYYVEALTPTSGTFRVNYEDAQQGADHDMDAIVKYHYVINNDNSVTISLESTYAAGCVTQHVGYVISGTTADGVYLEVRDADTHESDDIDYFLDTPAGEAPGGNWKDQLPLPLKASRTFTPAAPTATLLKSPLFYSAKWGGFSDKNKNNLPDRADEWDRDKDGIPDNYYLAHNATNLKTNLTKAIETVLARSSAIAGLTSNAGTLNDETRLYQVIFNSDDWSGHLLSFPIDTSSGELITTGSALRGAEWDASDYISAQNYNTGREITTYKPSQHKGIPFRWPSNPTSPGSSELDTAAITALNTNPVNGSIDNLGQSRLNFIRGDESLEEKNGGIFRDRTSKLGDIIHSSATFVGQPNFPYLFIWPNSEPEYNAPYANFKLTHQNRTPMLYIGANDGMLHAINAANGQELMAHVPSPVIKNLNYLTDKEYAHKYYVDGTPTIGDVFYNGAWHTALVGNLGKGGQGIYALDITDPSTFSEGNASQFVLWEFTDADDADLGYTYSVPVITRMANGRWAAIFGNGYNNTETDTYSSITGNAVLYIVDIETGQLIKKIDTGIGSAEDPTLAGRPNGLASPSVVDVNGDAIADYIYAGDLFGHLWKFNVSSKNVNSWKIGISGGDPLFTAKYGTAENAPRQPITSKPAIVKFQKTLDSYMVLFGTGKYLEDSDKADTSIQTFYAIVDNQSSAVSDRSELLQQSILSELSVTPTSGDPISVRITSDNQLSATHRGWYMDLIYNQTATGERQITYPVVRGEKIVFTTLIPSSHVCDYGGSGWLMELNAQTGSRLDHSPMDLNGDGEITTADLVNYNGSPVAISGKKSEVGILPTPKILDAGTVEYKYNVGSSGNIDVITENPGASASGRQSWRQIK